jgi:hypothetical protein
MPTMPCAVISHGSIAASKMRRGASVRIDAPDDGNQRALTGSAGDR